MGNNLCYKVTMRILIIIQNNYNLTAMNIRRRIACYSQGVILMIQLGILHENDKNSHTIQSTNCVEFLATNLAVMHFAAVMKVDQ